MKVFNVGYYVYNTDGTVAAKIVLALAGGPVAAPDDPASIVAPGTAGWTQCQTDFLSGNSGSFNPDTQTCVPYCEEVIGP